MFEREEYKRALRELGNDELYEETTRMIYLSSIRYDVGAEDCHWKVGLIFVEWFERDLASEYERAHDEVSGK